MPQWPASSSPHRPDPYAEPVKKNRVPQKFRSAWSVIDGENRYPGTVSIRLRGRTDNSMYWQIVYSNTSWHSRMYVPRRTLPMNSDSDKMRLYDPVFS